MIPGSMAMNGIFGFVGSSVGYLTMPMNRIPFAHMGDTSMPSCLIWRIVRNWNVESMYPPGFYFSVCAIVDIDMSRTSQSVLSQQYMNSDYSRMYSISQIPLSTASSLPNSFSNYGASRSSYFNLAPSSSSCSEYDGIRHAGSFGDEDTPVVELFFVFHTDRQHRTWCLRRCGILQCQ